MARKESIRQHREATPTIIGAGITEMWYFQHLQSKYRLRLKLRPRFFGNENVGTLEKRIAQIIADGGRAIVVFDADVSTWNDVERRRLDAPRRKYAKNNHVLLCDSLPSIEYWFLLHYVNTTRHFGTSKAVVQELTKHIIGFDKTETFLKHQKWVDDMVADGRMAEAYNRAKQSTPEASSYTNVWKAIKELGLTHDTE